MWWPQLSLKYLIYAISLSRSFQAVSGLIEKESHEASSDDGSQNANNSAAEDGDVYSGDESSAPVPAVTSAKLSRVTTSASARSKKSTGASTSSKKTTGNKQNTPVHRMA